MIKISLKKKIWLSGLLITTLAVAGYFIYDKFFAHKTMVASINPYNFTDVSIVDLYVNGTWGGSINKHSGGGSSVCCVLVPEKWRPGLVVNVKWHKTEDQKLYVVEAEIPQYTESAGLQILFMKNDQVKVYLQDYWPCTPMHPMPKDKELCGEVKKP